MTVTEIAGRHPTKTLLLIVALVFAAVTGMVLTVFDRAMKTELQASTESMHSAFTRVFVNDHWEALRPLLDLDGRLPNPAANPRLQEIDRHVRGFAKGTDLVAVRIFNAAGVIQYASDPALIGKSLAADEGFLAASRGRVSSELIHRTSFNGFDGVLRDRSLVESYVPVRGVAGVEAVVEMYTDRTASVTAQGRQRNALLGWLLPGLGLGFAVVLLSSTWINRVIQRREALARADAQESLIMSEAAVQAAEAQLEVLHLLVAQVDESMGRMQARAAAGDVDGTPAELQRDIHRLSLWSRLQSGSPARARPQVALTHCIAEALQAVDDAASRQAVKLAVHVEDNVRDRLPPDADALQEVLRLLLDSALDTMGAGTLQVKAQAVPTGVSIDLISGSGNTRDSGREAVNRRMADSLAGLAGGRLDTKFTPGRGGWYHLLWPSADQMPPARRGA